MGVSFLSFLFLFSAVTKIVTYAQNIALLSHLQDNFTHFYPNIQTLGVTGDMTSYNILLKSCCLAARVDLAQDIYSEVQQLESRGVLKLDVFTYSTIIKVYSPVTVLT